MGTRSTTKVFQNNNAIVCMYRQMDGYPTGHGKELFDFLDGGEVVNGLGLSSPVKIFNGMGCLAAQMVAHFKTGPGGFYLESPDCEREQYNYEIHGGYTKTDKLKSLKVIVKGYDDKILFSGSVAKFGKFCLKD